MARTSIAVAAKDDYLIENLIDMGYVTPDQVEVLRPEAEAAGMGVVDLMVERKLINAATVTQAKATHFGLEMINLGEMRLEDEVISSVPRHVAKKYRVVPVFKHGNHLSIALSDPSDLGTIDSLQHVLRADIEVKVATEAELDTSWRRDGERRK